MSDHHIGEAKLTAMVLHAARGTTPELPHVTLRYMPTNGDGPNWELAGITFGSVADRAAARRAVNEAVAVYRLHWKMVPDGDLRDEQAIGPLSAEELSRLRARTPPDP